MNNVSSTTLFNPVVQQARNFLLCRSDNITVRYDSARCGKQPVYIVFGMKIPLITTPSWIAMHCGIGRVEKQRLKAAIVGGTRHCETYYDKRFHRMLQ